jgi:hypothetical protein
MGAIAVHEFIALGTITDASEAILPGRTTFEMFAPAWSNRTVEDDPGAPFFNDTHKYAIGRGERLWGDGVDPTKLRLKETDVYDNGVVHLAYGPA